MITVFYAWQLDRDKKVCRYLIRNAVKAAAKKIKAHADVKSAPPFDLDEATKGVTGHPHIAATIRKKIKACDIFLADLTHVARYKTADGREKLAQNGNVLIELGMAIRAKGFGRLILVMNDAFGPPDDLPFDLKSHSYPITYTLADPSDPAQVKTAHEGLTKTIADKLKPMVDEILRAGAESERLVAAEEEAAARRRAEEQWTAFNQKVGSEGFRGLAVPKLIRVIGPGIPPEPHEAFVFLSIIPLTPPTAPLDLGAIERGNPHGLKPIGSSGWNNDLYGRSLVFHDGRRARDNRQAEPPNSVTELTDEGSVFAATSMGVGTRNDGSDVIGLEASEYEVLDCLTRYVRVLREVGIKGPLEVRVTLKGTAGAYVQPSRPILWDTSRFRKLTDDPIHLPSVTLTDDMDGKAITAAMRTAFIRVWRDGGLPSDPCFGTDGNLKV